MLFSPFWACPPHCQKEKHSIIITLHYNSIAANNKEKRKLEENRSPMQQWDERYSNFPSQLQEYLTKAETEVTELLKERPWVRAGLERLVWKKTGIYPSLVGQTIKTLNNYKRCWIGKLGNRDLRIVKQHRTCKVPKDFDTQHERLNMHLASTKFHSDVLEILLTLSFHIISERLKEKFDLRPDEIVHGQQFDSILCYLGTNIGVEARNMTGDASIGDASKYVQKCIECGTRPMMVATWLTSEAQKALGSNNGFFCNLCRIYTAEEYPEIQDDFDQNGFEKLVTVLDLKRWGWSDATEAKKWLKPQIDHERYDRMTEKAEQIFQEEYEKRALSHLLQKIVGISAYSFVTIQVESMMNAERSLRTFGSKSISERQKRQLSFIPKVYLNMLYNAGSERTSREIIESFSHIPFIKKQNWTNRIDFVESILDFLEDLNLVEKRGSIWTVKNAKSPYIEKTAIF
ncbi:hypothetical protein MUP77_23235 [Candidatus Bathyarchaeota archaeon]|nr:hypothetical protein [Candidatus Bathyarchaeota archaeon]